MPDPAPSSRASRLQDLILTLRDGRTHVATDLAARFGVTERTIYRDMERLQAEGVPVAGRPGKGYAMTAEITLPPLALSRSELEALHLGLSIIGEAGDPALRAAAESLSQRLDAVLPEDGRTAGAVWGFTPTPTGMQARHLEFLPTLRAALRGRQKLSVVRDGMPHRIRPLALEYWGRIWVCGAWCETCNRFHDIRLDEITEVEVLRALFVEEPGKDVAALRAAR
ncbi:helix-turn-helix transcriptional regulator [Dinoroseobacter sp. S375]|uniref:helix-turn-helix transcriptional regulator n=1 Tax=Dinoroseobacter sp. S375 TaxID=3415136 RepID=UPI003C7E8EFA